MRYTVHRKMYKDSDWREAISEFKSADKISGLIHTIEDAVADKANGFIFDWGISDDLRETFLSSDQAYEALQRAMAK